MKTRWKKRGGFSLRKEDRERGGEEEERKRGREEEKGLLTFSLKFPL